MRWLEMLLRASGLTQLHEVATFLAEFRQVANTSLKRLLVADCDALATPFLLPLLGKFVELHPSQFF